MGQGRQHGQLAQLLEAGQVSGVGGQQGGVLIEQDHLALGGQLQLADQGRQPLDAGVEPDHGAPVIALHRQRHARLLGGEEQIGTGGGDPARQRACLYQSRLRGS